MTAGFSRNGLLVLMASMVMMVLLGSVHAFSVFLEPLEAHFGASRGAVSTTYSLALVCLTISVLLGHRIYGIMRAPMLVGAVALLAALGCVIAAYAESLAMVWIGYSVIFGTANGVGYGFALQLCAQANPERAGLAMGLVTASYAIGAALAPIPFEALMRLYGFGGAFLGLAGLLVVAAPGLMGVMARAKAELRMDAPASESVKVGSTLLIIKLWCAYGAAVAAGLMVIGHATGIARANQLSDVEVLAAPVVVAALNMIGSLGAGWLSGRLAVRSQLTIYPVLTVIALAALTVGTSTAVTLGALGMIGFAYGATIAAFPAVVSMLFGPSAGIRAYGRVFTAWGTAGLLAPSLAGFLFERSGEYVVPLGVACALGVASIVAVWALPRSSPETRA
jgi:MFS transporter, OFA family, oxalate/formate antiporter